MDNSSPRAQFNINGNVSAFRLEIGSSGGFKAYYPIDVSQTEGVIKIRHQAPSNFDMYICGENGHPDLNTPIEIDWGDGTVTQETLYPLDAYDDTYPSQSIIDNNFISHVYADNTHRTITITPVSNTQIMRFDVHKGYYSNVDSDREYNIIDIDMHDAAGLKVLKVMSEYSLTDIDLSNSAYLNKYNFVSCTALNHIKFSTNFIGSEYSIYLHECGSYGDLTNVPDVDKLTTLDMWECTSTKIIDLSATAASKLERIHLYSCTNVEEILFHTTQVVEVVDIQNTKLSAEQIDTILDTLILQTDNYTVPSGAYITFAGSLGANGHDQTKGQYLKDHGWDINDGNGTYEDSGGP